ncbi:MAG: helix-hairpin-helix domain-containing protein [Synergistaceae bacterium]|jgi:competence protein ComEA|nr:helix-hairpin-helix domain-containing protein [Synergistaceae bacterium]
MLRKCWTNHRQGITLAAGVAFFLALGFLVHPSGWGRETSRPISRAEAASQPEPQKNAAAGQAPSAVEGTGAAGPTIKTEVSALIDVNRASKEELISLRGIGPVLAENIMEYRRKNGPFRSVEELIQVRGIGKKKLEVLRGCVTVDP